MSTRFFVGKGRYSSLRATRYMTVTYGRNSFAQHEVQPNEPRTHGSYGALLFDKRWLAKRQEILRRDSEACVVCNAADNLQVHHRQYHFIKSLEQFKPPWDYDNYLLITLCEKCHSKGHSKFKVPSICI